MVNQVISYHVNVGHGNCTFIAIKRTSEPRCEFWMVDCSLSEVHYKNSSATNFKANLEAAFDDVANEFHIERDEIRLSRFILTHKHYDHYILFTHVGFEKYANVIFTEPIYESRKIVRDYLASVGIKTIGRFGEWDYLWSD